MLQLSNYIATLVNGGNRYQTHLLKTVKSSDFSETVYEYEAQPVETLDLDPAYVEAVKKGMWEVANDEESTVDQYLRMKTPTPCLSSSPPMTIRRSSSPWWWRAAPPVPTWPAPPVRS